MESKAHSSIDSSLDPIGPRPARKSLTPTHAITFYSQYLTPFELEEIKSFSEVYFLGHNADKIQAPLALSSTSSTSSLVSAKSSTSSLSKKKPEFSNFGYDRDNGRYRCILNDHINYRYEILGELGQGTFGDVVKAFDHKTRTYVAVKITRNLPDVKKKALAEVGFLQSLLATGNAHAIQILDAVVFRSHICIVFELLGDNLYAALLETKFLGIPEAQIRTIAHDVLQCLSILHSQKVVHGDLKPENILFTDASRSSVKVIDFGLSCSGKVLLIGEIQSRYYRAPEVILESGFDMAIDMWSLGCILAELFTGRPLFPGRSQDDQLIIQMELLGLPSHDMIECGERAADFFDDNHNMDPIAFEDDLGNKRTPGSKTLAQLLEGASPVLVDFITRCLLMDPVERMNARDALSHPFLSDRRTTPSPKGEISKSDSGVSDIGHVSPLFIKRRSSSAPDLTSIDHSTAISTWI